LSEIGL